jgi:hypothetical protein
MILRVAILAELALTAVASRFGDFTVPGHATRLVFLLWGAGAFFFIAVSRFEAALTGHLRVARRSSFSCGAALRRPAFIFWGVAIALRTAMLECAPGDDMWRYIWEGRVQVHGQNPYVENPDSPALTALRTENWRLINHRESAAIYPPAAELIFRALAQLRPSVPLFKLVFVAADLLTAALILRLCTATRERDENRRLQPPAEASSEEAIGRRFDGTLRDYKAAAWYAWNPAVVYAFAGAGHYDSMMLLSLVATLALLYRADGQGPPAPENLPPMATKLAATAWAGAGCLGVAIALKIVPLFLLPAAALALRARSFVLVLSAAVPLALCEMYGGVWIVFRPLTNFADVTRFHDLFWWLVEAGVGPNPFQRNWPFTAAFGIAWAIVTFIFRRDWRRCVLWTFGVMLVLSPVLHPWYTVWILPIATWQRAHAWTVLSLSSLAALVLWDTTPWWTAWEPNLVTRALVIVPPLSVLLIGWRSNRARPCGPADAGSGPERAAPA